MMGVDYELFWTLNPKSLSPFTKAFSLKQKYDDSMAWQSGVYIRMAIVSSLNKEAKYPKRPMMADKVKEKGMSSEEIKNRVMAQSQKINAKFEKKGGN
jgi:hypothetical protein